MTRLLLERAWLGGEMRSNVLVEIEAGRFVRVEADRPDADAEAVQGLVIPGLANTHSHAFHRALRGRTQRDRGTFWTWREQMYAVAERLDPDSYHRLATATYAEMVAAGTSAVGEFHYLHHAPDGRPYGDHAMERALVDAAADAGIRITLLDTVYLSSGFGAPVEGVQRRYSDGDVKAWRDRVTALAEHLSPQPHVRVGVAIHSVRAVPAADLAVVAETARDLGAVVHVHVSEQVAENAACQAAYGRTPTELLAEHDLLGPATSLVHATHLTAHDVARIGASGCSVSLCPTTERDLGDGIGPARALGDAGARLTLGSDSHAVIDPYEEMRALELDERLATRQRGHFTAAELLAAGTHAGHASLGWDDVGRIEVGARADLVVLDAASARTAGTGASGEAIIFAASPADVRAVVIDGVRHTPDPAAVGRALADAIGTLTEQEPA